LWNSANIYDAGGKRLIATIAQGQDITDRKLYLDMLSKRTEELARSNQELQQFAYVASHDLQEPLRMISSYMQLIEQRYKGRLDPEADEFIGYAVDGAKRLSAMISGLLDYSRIGTKGCLQQLCDSAELLTIAEMNLTVSIRDSGTKVSRGQLPVIYADRPQIIALFQNLISNAIKFRGEETPRVHVSASRTDGFWQFSVEDNGIGIEPQYRERVFVIFRRLHGKEVPGTGIGLAICKRIVERHGGKIWVEPGSQNGSKFCFTLPASAALE
jgi:light-regulated signal transduction histidine kinase (bacteriophytochrome)